MDVLTGFDIARGETDDLVVAVRGLSLRDVAHRDLVTRGDRDSGAHVFLLQQSARRQLSTRDDDVVVRVQSNGEIGGLQHGGSLPAR